jgi:hypothetical protein
MHDGLQDIFSFLGCAQFFDLFLGGHFSLRHLDINKVPLLVSSLFSPILVLEVLFLLIHKKFRPKELSRMFDVPFGNAFLNALLMPLVAIDVTLLTYERVRQLSPFEIAPQWYWFPFFLPGLGVFPLGFSFLLPQSQDFVVLALSASCP